MLLVQFYTFCDCVQVITLVCLKNEKTSFSTCAMACKYNSAPDNTVESLHSNGDDRQHRAS